MAHKYSKLMDKKFAKSKSVFHMKKEEVEQLDEYGNTARGQKMLAKVQKRATDRLIKADDKNRLEPDVSKRDLNTVRKNAATAQRAYDRMEEEVEQMDEIRRMKTKFNPLDPFSQKSVARQKLSNLMRSGHAKGALIANKMRTLNADTEIDAEDLEALHEVLSKDATASDWIHDFVHSDNPKFEGKTKKERIKMALGAYYAKQRNEEVELDEATPTRQQVKQAIGIARDKRYAGGNMTGATKAMDKLNKGLAQHPAVSKELQKQNEEVEQIDELSKDTLGSYIKKAADSAAVKRKIGSDFEHMADKAKKPGNKAAATALADKYKAQSRDRRANIGKAVDRLTKEETDKDEREYGYEGDMAIAQLKTLVRHADHLMGMLKPDTDLPEWVQSKITLATDYMQTAHDYLMSELSEANKVSGKHVNVDNVNAAGQEPHPEEWVDAKKVMKKPVKESYDEEGNLIQMTKTYKEFISEMEFVGGKYVHKGTYGYGGKGAKYGGTDYDNEDMDKKDDDEAGEQKAKRGPKVGSKRGPRTNLGSSKLHQK